MSIRLMLPGEISIVTCPPDYAYDKFERFYFFFKNKLSFGFVWRTLNSFF